MDHPSCCGSRENGQVSSATLTEGRQFAVSIVGLVVSWHPRAGRFCEHLPVGIVELSAATVYTFHNSLTGNDSGLSEFGQRQNGMALAEYPTRSVLP